MADGFLSPDGTFFEKEETYHAETARRILKAGSDVLEPIQELLRQGYIAFIEFRNPLAKESLQPDLDYVLCSHSHVLTKAQNAWLQSNKEQISRRQQFYINKDNSYTFQELTLSDVEMYEACEGCDMEPERMKWCNAERAELPEQCEHCPYRKKAGDGTNGTHGRDQNTGDKR